MRLVDQQRRLRERGRIRIGYSTTNERGKKIPHKLDRFRFTSGDRRTIEMVAQLYGGEVEAWNEGDRSEWSVTTNARSLPVVFVSAVSFSQSYELWQGGFLKRICDGETAHVPGKTGRMVSEECSCDPDERECQRTTHLGLILPELPGLGTWRLVSKGYNAAAELLGAVELIEGAIARGLTTVPALLSVERREVRRIVDGKAQVRKFAVPVLDLDVSVSALGTAAMRGSSMRAEVEAETPVELAESSWSPVKQEALPPAPFVSVADHLADNERDPKPRRDAAPTLPPSGRERGPKAPESRRCDVCGEPIGSEPVVRNPEPGGSPWIHAACAAEDGTDRDGRGSTSGDTGTVAEPPPPVVPIGRAMPHTRHKEIMACTAEAFPAPKGMPSGDVEELRKLAVLGIVGYLGMPGLTSRTQLPAKIGQPLVDVLRGIKAERYVWDGADVWVTETGAKLDVEGLL